jgi:protein TonB
VHRPPPSPSPPKAVEAPPPKLRPPLRVEAPKPQAKPAAKPAPSPRPAEAQSRSPSAQASRGAASTSAPSSAAASAASLSGYIAEVSAEIRSRLFYPDAARARGAKGVVGVAFSIGPSSAVTSFAITCSSGDHDLDAAARSLVQGARFPPPPGRSARVATNFNYAPR